MKELLITIAQGLVEDPSAVSVDVDAPDEEGTTVYHLHVAQQDMGRVIGKQGRIAKAIRTVMKSVATRANEKIRVELPAALMRKAVERLSDDGRAYCEMCKQFAVCFFAVAKQRNPVAFFLSL